MPDIGPTQWHNPPPEHSETATGLTLRTGRDTDYWNNTFYGFKHGNGHFRATQVGGDFSMEISFVADYRHFMTRLAPWSGWMARTGSNAASSSRTERCIFPSW